MIKKGFLPVFSQFLKSQELRNIISENQLYLEKIGAQEINNEELTETEQLYYFVITGGTEQQILDLQQKRSDEKIVLLAHATHNSLPAALEVLARFQQEGKNGSIIYLPEMENEIENQTSPNIQKFEDYEILAGKRIGLIGDPSDWLVASSPTPEVVKTAFGVEVIKIQLDELKQLFKQIRKANILAITNDFINNSVGIYEAELSDIYKNIRVYKATKKLIKKYNLDAFTIRCFDLVLKLKTTGCFALSRLNDEGIIAGCEGDLVSTIGMMIAYQKIGKLPWMANPAQIDIINNTLILAHCTVPCSLVPTYKIRSHFESGIGVGIQGEFPLQEVEIFRIGGKNLDKIWKVKGKIIQTGNDENLCRTQIKVKLDDEYSVQDLLVEPLGNHLVVCSTQSH